MTNKVPENGDENRPASTLHTDYECGECGRGFDNHRKLAHHTAQCNGSGE